MSVPQWVAVAAGVTLFLGGSFGFAVAVARTIRMRGDDDDR